MGRLLDKKESKRWDQEHWEQEKEVDVLGKRGLLFSLLLLIPANHFAASVHTCLRWISLYLSACICFSRLHYQDLASALKSIDCLPDTPTSTTHITTTRNFFH